MVTGGKATGWEVAMLEDCKTALERWDGVHRLIDRWLDQRRELQDCFIALREACDIELAAVSKAQLDAFSELLMDYVSSGHFKVYPQLREEAAAFNDSEALLVAERLLARLDHSTELVLAFDEDYSSPVKCQHNLEHLPVWCERLSKGVAERFALEDQLIGRLHAAHSPPPDTQKSTSAPP